MERRWRFDGSLEVPPSREGSRPCFCSVLFLDPGTLAVKRIITTPIDDLEDIVDVIWIAELPW